MPKVPRDVSHDAFVRFLMKRGWTEAPTGTRHTALEKGDEIITIPRHSKLKTGLVSAILKQAGISVEDAARNL